jgi:hypothetical protein
MPSLEQIIRPFVVDPTTPPVPVVTTANRAPPEPVRLSIGIGSTRLHDLPSGVAPIITLPPLDPSAPAAGQPLKVIWKQLSSSHSFSVSCYMTGRVREDPFAQGSNPFGIGAGI